MNWIEAVQHAASGGPTWWQHLSWPQAVVLIFGIIFGTIVLGIMFVACN